MYLFKLVANTTRIVVCILVVKKKIEFVDRKS